LDVRLTETAFPLVETRSRDSTDS